ncbi:MAG: family 16 glycoside hydrolase [Armatimonadota bacterium]
MTRLHATILVTCVTISIAAAEIAAADWELQLEDDFQRENLGDDWWASGLTEIENGRLTVGREDDMGRNLVICTQKFDGATRLEYDAMAPVENPSDLSAIINGSTDGYSSGYFFGFGSQHNTTGRFILRGITIDEYDATITPGEWHHVVCERFEDRFRHIIDGETVLEYTHEDPLPGPLHRQIGLYVWHKGVFDNVKVFTQPEEVEVVEAVSGQLPSDELVVTPRAYPRAGKVGLSVDVPAFGAEYEHVTLHTWLHLPGPDRMRIHKRVTVPNIREEVIFDVSDVPAGEVQATAVVFSGEEKLAVVGGDNAPTLNWPGRDPRYADVKALNNLVWEMVNAGGDAANASEHTFTVPIQRWLYIRSQAEVNGGSVRLILDTDDPEEAITVHDGSQRVMVAKRRVEAGEHTIHVTTEGRARLTKLEVRAIPDVQHSRYPTNRWLKSNPRYDWEFISRHILPSATTIITSGDPERITDNRIEEWIAEGGRWIVYTSRPGLHGNREIEESGERLFEHYSSKPGFAHPLMDGVLVDEFYTPNDPAYPSYIRMAELLAEKWPEKGFFPYVAGRFGQDEGSVEFTKACVAADGMICREAYIAEWDNLRAGLDYMRRAADRMVHPIDDALPGVIENTVWVAGTFSFPWPYADGFPSVNYNAYLDMQMQMLATHPAWFGLGGVHTWRSGYSDEERVRWMGRLFEHYFIEGNTRRFSADPYLLDHIDNPDFVDGLEGWTVASAGEDDPEPMEIEGFGSLQGRYYRGNDSALVMRRGEQPNTITQTIRGLQVGRTYSVKMLSADYEEFQQDKSAETLHGVEVQLADCDPIEGGKYDYQEAFNTRRRLGEFTRQNPLYLNYHWHVFRATGTTARLTITDAPGEAGQQLLVNFIEVKPFLMD